MNQHRIAYVPSDLDGPVGGDTASAHGQQAETGRGRSSQILGHGGGALALDVVVVQVELLEVRQPLNAPPQRVANIRLEIISYSDTKTITIYSLIEK